MIILTDAIEPKKHVRLKKPGTKEYTEDDSIYRKFKHAKNYKNIFSDISYMISYNEKQEDD